MFSSSDYEVYGILAAQPGMESISPTLENEVLTTGPTREVLIFHFLLIYFSLCCLPTKEIHLSHL